jgi:muramoyltetrapeptide carboxypeptidase
MVTPPYLKPGDKIGIVSTARKITTSELQPLLDLLEGWDLKYELGRTINAEDRQFAGDTDLRTLDFQKMLDNPDIKAIWCARGGYGTVKIIDLLDFSEFIKQPKWIVGYSDATVLHTHIHSFGIETLHANMAIDIDTKTEATRSSVKNALFGRDSSIKMASEGSPLNRTGQATGQLVGGNLSLLFSLIGSPSEIKTTGKILFIEDLDEMLYHIDRMVTNLKRNGMLEDLAGLIVGGMSDMRDNAVPFGRSAEEIIHEAVAEYEFPVCFNFPAGHINDNRALILGRKVNLQVGDSEVLLKFSET